MSIKSEFKKMTKKINKSYQLKTNKLIMTLLVKDEEDIIRQNILFHKAMGVDGIIVTDNNSSDRTLEILEELKQDGIDIRHH